MKIKRVSIRGFLPFKDETIVDLESFEGKTILIDGKNNDDSMSNSNGSGKSSLLRIVCWVLFGQLPISERVKNDVINENSSECIGELQFSTPGSNYRIIRKRIVDLIDEINIFEGSSEILSKSTKTVKQAKIEDIIGCDIHKFLQLTTFGEGTVSFPDLLPSDRGKVLFNIANLERFFKGSSNAAKTYSKVTKDISKKAVIEQEIKRNLKTLKEEDFEKQIQLFEKTRRENITRLKEELAGIESTKDTIIKNNEQNIKTTNERKNRLEEAISKGTEVEKALQKERSNLNDLFGTKRRLESEKTEYQVISRERKKSMGVLTDTSKKSTCPTCLTPVDSDRINNHLKKLEKEENNSVGTIKLINEELLIIHKEIETKTAEADSLKTELDGIKYKKSELKHVAKSLQQLTESLDENIKQNEVHMKRIFANIEDWETRENPYLEMDEKNRKKYELESLRLEKIMKEKKEDEEVAENALFWKDGYKQIPFLLLDEIIIAFQEQLDFLLSTYSSELRAEIKSYRKTKRGSDKQEIYIYVETENGFRPYEMLSTGEKAKIKIAVSLALVKVIEEFMGINFNFMVFDEPNTGLDETGKTINLEMFETMALDEKAIFVTDHDASFKNVFDKVLVVEKTNGKSILVN